MPLGENIKFKKRKLFSKTEPEKSTEAEAKKEAIPEEKIEKIEVVEEVPEIKSKKKSNSKLKKRAPKVFQTQKYLLFKLQGSMYGFEASVVKEIFRLPEVTPVDEAPDFIVGVLNFRGQIVPIMDLDLRLGRQHKMEYNIDDSVIMLQLNNEGFMVGVIVNQVDDVFTIQEHQMEASPFEDMGSIIYCDVKLEEEIVMIIDPSRLLPQAVSLEDLISEEGQIPKAGERKYFCPNATEEERKTFRDRAISLVKSSDAEDDKGLIGLAVVGLNGEYFGVDLEVIREFSDLTDITPIPCCPGHIVGSINLRGDILTLVDIRSSLKMPLLSIENLVKVVVLDVSDFNVGVPVDNVYDIIYIRPETVTSIPTAIQSVSDEFLKGTAPYEGKMLSIIDLQKMFISQDLIVSEEV